MTAPPVTLSVEPSVNGQLRYLPMAPTTPSSTAKGRILVELVLQNTGFAPVMANTMIISFTGAAVTGPTSVPIGITIDPKTSQIWNLPSPTSHYLFELAAPPSAVTISVYFATFTDPVTLTLPVAPHAGPDGLGAYRFPSLAKDLALGEFWQLNGCNHATGNHQSFAYDMSIWGVTHGTNDYSPLEAGGVPSKQNPAPNSDYRIFGKPVRAMAAGEVIEVVNTCPNNPNPFYADTDAEMTALLDGLKPTYSSFPNGEGGNHVIVRHGDELALYAHMQQGSIDADLKARIPAKGSTPAVPGTMVVAGQLLGQAGNSGRSSAPHLHIHAVESPFGAGGPRPLVFKEAWAIDNDTIMGTGFPGKLTGDPGGTWVPLNGVGIPPGSVEKFEDYVGDSFVLPSGRPTWPEVVHLSVEENDYQALYQDMAALGLSPAWISTHTIEKGPFFFYTFFDVVFRPSLGADEPTFHGLDLNGFTSTKNTMEGKGYHVKQLESYFSMRQGRQLFAVIFARYPALKPRKPAQSYPAQTYSQHRATYNARTAEGYVPASVSVVSVNGTLSYTALYEFRGGTVTVDIGEQLTSAGQQQRFDDNHKLQRFQTYLKGYLHQGQTYYSGVWLSGATDGKVRNDLRATGFQTVLNGQRRGNHLLRSISGYQMDGDAAYAGIWQA